MAWPCNRGDFMNLVPKEILMSHLKRSEGAEEVSLPIDFFRDLLYQAMPRTWVGLIPEEIDEIIENSIDKVDALIQTMDKLKEKNS
jgi:hypothetical protein